MLTNHALEEQLRTSIRITACRLGLRVRYVLDQLAEGTV